jgi:hypothetical protein
VLFKPIYKQPRLNIDSSHAVQLAELGWASSHREISEQEVNVTQQFIGPGYNGGILSILQQPLNYHLYWKGQDSVILSCKTFALINKAPRAVTCGCID